MTKETDPLQPWGYFEGEDLVIVAQDIYLNTVITPVDIFTYMNRNEIKNPYLAARKMLEEKIEYLKQFEKVDGEKR